MSSTILNRSSYVTIQNVTYVNVCVNIIDYELWSVTFLTFEMVLPIRYFYTKI